MKIITKNINPPIPTRSFDWCAYEEDSEENGLFVWGKTEAEAITALKELIDPDFTEDLAWLKTM